MQQGEPQMLPQSMLMHNPGIYDHMNPFAGGQMPPPVQMDHQQMQDPKRRRVQENGVSSVTSALPLEAAVRVQIPNDFIGKVIGAQGAVIKRIRESSQAACQTDRQGERQDNMRELIISGPLPAVMVALQMVQSQFLLHDK